MSRPPGIEGAHLWYHIYNRGNEKRVVFHDDDDRNSFLDLLFESAALFAVDVHSFALMPNHFHLMIATGEANLCQFMQQFQNRVIKVYNARHARVGHVFQDRYKAIVVDSEEYGSVLSRYIHLNIVRSGTMKTAGVRERLAMLRSYPWSSYRTYVGHEPSRWPGASPASRVPWQSAQLRTAHCGSDRPSRPSWLLLGNQGRQALKTTSTNASRQRQNR